MLQRTHIRGWAVVWGCVASFVATGVAAFLTTLFVLVANDQMDASFVSLCLGLIATVTAGYVAAFLAPQDELINAGVVGVVMLLVSLLLAVWIGGQQAPVVLLGIVLTPLAALAGGLLRDTQVG